MANKVILKASDGTTVEFYDEIKAQGGVKDVYFSIDKTYVVAFYRKTLSPSDKNRLENIVGPYHKRIFETVEGKYWKDYLIMPDRLVEWNGKIGVVLPFYPSKYFFKGGPFDGKEKEGKWFASAKLRNRFVPADQKGTWLSDLHMCLKLARAVRRLHAAGLAHSDLSYKNVLVDPSKGMACVIDVDGLVVPGKFPPDVVGTPDFIAPEVVKTSHLVKDDPQRSLPKRETDLHALAVLIYMYLLYRHPLRGGKVHTIEDEQRDESLTMGERALFIEHPTDKSNRIKLKNVKSSELPWADTEKIPFTVAGPYLKTLFLQAFVIGLHDPSIRPSANDWETALVKTVDLIQPCHNSSCEQKWYVFDNSIKPKCPFCGTPFKGKLPVLNLYSSRKEGSFRPDNHRLMVYTNQSIFQWHVNNLLVPNEKLTEDQKKRVGYFVFHTDQWWLVNERLQDLMDVTKEPKVPVPIGEKLELKDGQKILFAKGDGGRLAVVQMVEA